MEMETELSKADREPPRRAGRLPPLSPAVRILVLVVGWLLVLVGIAGLVLPGLQGILTLLLGAALLSLASRSVHHALRRLFQRWPRGWRKLLRLRRRVHGWLSRK